MNPNAQKEARTAAGEMEKPTTCEGHAQISPPTGDAQGEGGHHVR